MKKILLALGLTSTLFLTSCATIFTGTRDTLRFDSNPQGAMVYINGIEVGRTPCVTKVKRGFSNDMVEMKMQGYETRVFMTDKSFNAVSIINLGFVLGWIIDLASGSIMKHDRKSFTIELDPKLSALNPDKIEINTDNKTIDVFIVKQ